MLQSYTSSFKLQVLSLACFGIYLDLDQINLRSDFSIHPFYVALHNNFLVLESSIQLSASMS